MEPLLLLLTYISWSIYIWILALPYFEAIGNFNVKLMHIA